MLTGLRLDIEQVTIELMIHRSVKTEIGDGDRHSTLAVWPWPRHEFYIGDMDQVVVATSAASCRRVTKNGMLRRLLVAGFDQLV